MRTELYWETVADHLEAIRDEAAIRRQLTREAPNNLWARLLPPLRRLEGWLERHAGGEKQSRALVSR